MKKSLHLITMLAQFAVLGLASCNKEKTFTVTFNANGGTGTMSVQTFTGNESQALAANAFTKEGYEFVNWNTMADGSGNSYADKQTITLTDNMTLFAQWRAKTPATPEEMLKGKWTIRSYKVDGDMEPMAIGEVWNFKEDGTFVGWLDEYEGIVHCNYIFINNMLILKGGELVDMEDGEYEGEIQYKMYVDEISATDLELSGRIEYSDGYETEIEGAVAVTLKKE